MEIYKEINDEVAVLKLEGRLDAVSSKNLKDAVNELLKENKKSIVLDMLKVDFIDSSGLGSLVSCLKAVNKEHGDIRLSSLQDQVRSILELTRLYRVFQIFDDTDSAIKSY